MVFLDKKHKYYFKFKTINFEMAEKKFKISQPLHFLLRHKNDQKNNFETNEPKAVILAFYLLSIKMYLFHSQKSLTLTMVWCYGMNNKYVVVS